MGLEPPTSEAPSGITPGAQKTIPLKVGAMLPLTGDGAAYGLPIQKAGQLAVDEINASGGIGGRTFQVIWEDGQCDAKSASAATQKLVNVDKVKYILGGVCSSEVLAGAPLAESSEVLWISPSATSPDITNAGDYIFRTAPSDALAGKIAAQYAYNTMEAKTVAVVSENKDYTQGLRKVFTEFFIGLGGKVTADEVYNEGDTDFRTQFLKVKTAKPDVVYLLPQTPASGLLLVKQLRDQKITAKLLTAEVLPGRDVVKENAKLLEGVVGIEPYFNAETPEAQAFVAAYKTANNNEELAFPSFMANYYSQFYLLKTAVETAGDDSMKVKDWLYTVKDWKHVLGSLTFDSNGDPLAEYQILELRNGEVKPLETVRPE
ncbi:MAG: hypothetical protein A2939_01230 [Parcubacteria group bacterium RIFCSPLOWO2_01_FULL_48_18]|nr:MAG: hypothetical protein A2939_01230 [Parcubacteria group bacterium RIFCSPLOWO2_01_FULL_48_18]